MSEPAGEESGFDDLVHDLLAALPHEIADIAQAIEKAVSELLEVRYAPFNADAMRAVALFWHTLMARVAAGRPPH